MAACVMSSAGSGARAIIILPTGYALLCKTNDERESLQETLIHYIYTNVRLGHRLPSSPVVAARRTRRVVFFAVSSILDRACVPSVADPSPPRAGFPFNPRAEISILISILPLKSMVYALSLGTAGSTASA